MPTLERLARQTAAIQSILGIVRTMKALAAVNIPAAERAAESASAFHQTVLDGLSVARRALPKAEARPPTRDAPPRIAIAFGTDHGLCGGFNEAVAQTVIGIAGHARVFAVGGRIAGAVERGGRPVDRIFRAAAASDGLRGLAAELILALDAASQTAAPHVDLIHQTRTPGGKTAVERARLLPLGDAFFADLARRPWPGPRLPMLPADASPIFRSLTRQHLAISLYRAGALSIAAEHTTRLALMSHAEKELDRRHEEVAGAHRRLRQVHITDELLDIVSGFDAIGAIAAET
ncbi:MAG: F0F1 ATP synthase subunit gamma [Pseudomonadota bacterium]